MENYSWLHLTVSVLAMRQISADKSLGIESVQLVDMIQILSWQTNLMFMG